MKIAKVNLMFRLLRLRLRRIITMTPPVLFLFLSLLTFSQAQTQTVQLQISNVTDNLSTYPNHQVPQYSKFELTFDIQNTVATNLQWPYDPNTPAGLAVGQGISVDGLITQPDQTIVIQPGFLYQDYTRQIINNRDHLYPNGTPVWKIRFAPKQQGIHRYQIRVQDAQGTSFYPSQTTFNTFVATGALPGKHGFVKVADKDRRYFELSDGNFFTGIGHNSSFNSILDAESQFDRYNPNGLNFFRIWMDGSTIAGSSWSPWVWFGGPWYGGYMPDPGTWINPEKNPLGRDYQRAHRGGEEFDFTFESDYNPAISWTKPCIFDGFGKPSISVKPGTTYRLSTRVWVEDGMTGPRNPAYPNYGFTVKHAGWASGNQVTCPDSLLSSSALIPHIQSTGPNWVTAQGSLTTGPNQYFLDHLYMVMDNTNPGAAAHVGYLSMKEVFSDSSLGPELLVKSSANMHYDFNQRESFMWDVILDKAAQKDIYLKLVILEHNDRVWNFINSDGTMNQNGTNDNFYAAANGSDNKVRRLEEYYYRYLAARWGYSTAVHSWEFNNEGDPFNGNHYNATEALGRFIHAWDRNHLAATSNWHSYPVTQFWGNLSYPNVDYADFHAYSGTGPFYPDSNDTTNLYLQYSNWIKGQQNPQKPVVRGELGFACPADSSTMCDFTVDISGVWLHKFLWSHLDAGYYYDIQWYLDGIWNPSKEINQYPVFKRFADFIKGIPLNNGNYQDIQASSASVNLRVIGQKDTTLGKAHLWIDNKNHTWKNVVDGVSVAPESGRVTFSGMPQGDYTVSWIDTYSSPLTVTRTESITVDFSGVITLNVSNLDKDIAVKLESASASQAPGDVNQDTQVNVLDIQACVNHILGIQDLGSRADVNGDGSVNVLDVQNIVNIILGV